MKRAGQCLCVFVSAIVIASAVFADEPETRAEVTADAAKSVTAAKTAIRGWVSDAVGETYGVVGLSSSPDGAGLGAANTNGGADLVLDGSADGQPDAILTQDGLDRPSASHQPFTLYNSGAGRLDLYVEGILFGDGAGLSNVNAALLDGHTSGQFALDVDLSTSGSSSVHWDNITSAPAGLSDGDDDTLGDLGCAADQIARWSGSSWVCSDDLSVAYSRTLVVAPVGTASENGTALLAALAAIPTPASRAEAWLFKIEPGTYDVGTTSFEMKSWVDVEGSGQDVTLIRGAICDTGWSMTKGVVVGAESAELRLLTVENTCFGANMSSTGIYNTADNARFNHVTSSVFGAAEYNHAVYNEGLDVVFEFVTAEAGGANGTNRGLVDGGVGVRISNARVSGLAGGATSTGLELFGGSTVVSDVEVIARNATAHTWAVFNGGSNVVFTNITATASSTHGGEQFGMWATEGGFTLADSNIQAQDAANLDDMAGGTVVLNNATLNGSRYGIHADVSFMSGSVDIYIDHSLVRGPTNSLRFDYADVFVGGSQIAGGAVSNLGSGTITCAGVWDESYTFYASSCP